MAKWEATPKAGTFSLDAAKLKRLWKALHQGDQEPLPTSTFLLAAWQHFHNGAFEKAHAAGLKLGAAGTTLANKAACIYANYLEPHDRTRHDIFLQVAKRAAAQAALEPENPAAYYWQAYALGRYSQSISVAKALAQGLGGKVKHALETTITLQPEHAEAHIALGMFHAEVIDKVGAMIGNMTYGAKKDTSLELFAQGLALAPQLPGSLIEYANALVMLEGDRRMDEATALYEQAASLKARDSMEWLDINVAQSELADS